MIVKDNDTYFMSDNGLYERCDEKIILLRYLANEDTANILCGTTDIANYAMANLPIHNVDIPDTVVKIGDGAFAFCSQLREFICPTNLNELGNSVLSGCDSLVKVEFSPLISAIRESGIGSCLSHLEKCVVKHDTCVINYFDFQMLGRDIPNGSYWHVQQLGLIHEYFSIAGDVQMDYEYSTYHFVLCIHKGTMNRVDQALQEHCTIVEID